MFPHCMFPVECTIEGLGVRLPDVCPCEPLTSGIVPFVLHTRK